MNVTAPGRPVGSPIVEATTADHESAVAAVVRAVAAVDGVRQVDLPPLGEAIEPDALNRTVRSLREGGFVMFPYAGYAVVAHATGEVAVYDGTASGVAGSSR